MRRGSVSIKRGQVAGLFDQAYRFSKGLLVVVEIADEPKVRALPSFVPVSEYGVGMYPLTGEIGSVAGYRLIQPPLTISDFAARTAWHGLEGEQR